MILPCIPHFRRLSTSASRWQKLVKPIKTRSYEKDTFFVTTPIYYVNADPHIGHLYTSLIADTIVRWQHLQNKNSKIKFSTGTDEHGIKIQQAASVSNISPNKYCDKIAATYKNLAEDFEINYTSFIRTTDALHMKTVEKFWNELYSRGNLYLENYEGWYCVPDETFLTTSQLKEILDKDGKKKFVSEESGHPVEWTKETNYLFKLSSYQEELKYWMKTNENVTPKKFHKILFDQISKEPLPDISVSRPSSRVSWGIPVPNDSSQTIYVWLDALVNYLTAAGYANDDANFTHTWPPDFQVIGKDILKFHGIYWPAFLIAANLEPPRTLLCHSHWTVSSEKMSKSKQNVVDPFDRANAYTPEGLRYFLLRSGVTHSDGNYNEDKVIRVLNSELADTLGNLLNRCTSESLNPNQEVPKIDAVVLRNLMEKDVTKQFVDNITALPEICRRHYNEIKFYRVVDAIIATLHSGNLFFESMKPWELKKNEADHEQLKVVLHITIECLRVVGILLQPIIPNLSSNILDRINIDINSRCLDDLKIFSWNNDQFVRRDLSSDKFVLFRRILLEHRIRKGRRKDCN
ncbi:hypothetical protein WA026_008424 [Henosepilachna vigintioctopunctata]|uniref:Methionine--tRNA ligase, mitochondrial n=1 Tax=Henosepilachna vigintioctopunctata TaxID=420089 RepID=A0AAW1UIM4_9CUCU